MVLGRVEKRAWGTYGLPGRLAFGKLFWVGAAWGFASITLLMATMYGVRVFEFGHLAIHGGRIVRFASFWAAFFLLVGLFEEFLLRGYLQFTLTRLIGFWPAAVLLSCTFGLIHLQNAGEQWTGLLAAAAIGFFFCLTLRRTGNLVVCGGISYGVGLGRDVFLFRAGQRDGFSRASAEVVVSRAAMAYGRDGWAGGQCALLCGDRGGVGGVREEISGSEVSEWSRVASLRSAGQPRRPSPHEHSARPP